MTGTCILTSHTVSAYHDIQLVNGKEAVVHLKFPHLLVISHKSNSTYIYYSNKIYFMHLSHTEVFIVRL